MSNPTKTQQINKGRQLATQLVQVLTQADAYNQDMNKLGFLETGSDPITQEDLDTAMAIYYPQAPAGTFKIADWNAGVYSIDKNGGDYRGGEDQSLLKIAV